MNKKLHNSNPIVLQTEKSSEQSAKHLFTPKMRRIFLENMMRDRNPIDYMEFKRVIRNMQKHTPKAGFAK